jgi:4-amino-4-deoxy-L-arabinose transferase-like glycosyltransferase
MKKVLRFLPMIILVVVFVLGGVLRFYNIQNNPPGLYIDEASIGYNSWTILTEGVDEHGVPYPVWFKSFGEYKMPLYIYVTSFFMALLGKSEFTVRVFSALSGTFTVVLLYFFLRKVLQFDKKLFSKFFIKNLPFVGTFLLAISPWHIQFSRAGFEVTVAVFIYLLAAYIFLFFLEKKRLLLLFVSISLFLLTVYTYHAFRVISPLTLITLFIYLFFSKSISRKTISIGVIYTAVCMLPIVAFSLTRNGSERFLQTSAFSEYSTHSLLETMITYPMVFLKNYLSFFSLHFLFNFGDGIGRHQIPYFGLLPRWEFPFLFFGFYTMIQRRKSLLVTLLFLILFLTPVPGALTRPSPHSLRALLMVISYTVIVGIGILSFLPLLRKRMKWGILLLIPIIVFEFSYYLHYYHSHYPKVNVLDWGGANKEMVVQAKKYQKTYPIIVYDDKITFAYDYFRFYDDTLRAIPVQNNWQIPRNWNKKDVLYIRPYYAEKNTKNLLHTVRLPNLNNDVYVQFWKLE